MILFALIGIVLAAAMVINACANTSESSGEVDCNTHVAFDIHADNTPIVHYQYDTNDMCYAFNIGE